MNYRHQGAITRRAALIAIPLGVSKLWAQTSSVVNKPALTCQMATRDGIQLEYRNVVIVFGRTGITIEGVDSSGLLPAEIPYDDIVRLIHKPSSQIKWWKWLLLVPLIVVSGRLDLVTIYRRGGDGVQSNAHLRLESQRAYQLITALEEATGLKAQSPPPFAQ